MLFLSGNNALNVHLNVCHVIDISRHKYKSHASKPHSYTMDAAILHHMRFYICVNMWWIGFYSMKLETNFYFYLFLILFSSVRISRYSNKESRKEWIRWREKKNRWVNTTFNASITLFFLVLRGFDKQNYRLWCQLRLYKQSTGLASLSFQTYKSI